MNNVDILNLITKEEYKMLEWYRDQYSGIDDNSGYTKVEQRIKSIEEVLNLCYANSKQDLFRMFNNKLILTKEFEYEKDTEELIDEMHRAMLPTASLGRENRNGSVFYQAFNDFIQEHFYKMYNNNFHRFRHMEYIEKQKNEEFLEALRLSRLGDEIWNLINTRTLVNNRYNGKTIELPLPNGKELKIQTGCKPLRILSKIAEAFELPGFEDFRITHSLVHNQKKLSGKINLSIHPLDYWTMSDNNCGWDSCMNWINEGGYRCGTIEMMNSAYVVVAYLESDTADKLYMGSNERKWNSKKWRQLFVVNESVILGIKSYPYNNNNISNFVTNWLKELAEKYFNVTYFTNDGNPFNYNDNDTYIIGESCKTCMFNFTTDDMYCDVGCAEYHPFYYSNATEAGINHINYSGDRQCICCGYKTADFSDDTSSLICEECLEGVYCDCCENKIYGTQHHIEGNILCDYCYENETFVCDFCDKITYVEKSKEIYFCGTDKITEILLSKTDKSIIEQYKELKYKPLSVLSWDSSICLDCYDYFILNHLKNGINSFKQIEVDFGFISEYMSYIPLEEVKDINKLVASTNLPIWLKDITIKPEEIINKQIKDDMLMFELVWYKE